MKYTLALLLLLACAPLATLPAQITFSITGTDGSQFPTMRATFEAKDRNGQPYTSYLPSEFTVVEDGITRPVTVISCPPPRTPPVSISLVIDDSYSMSIDNRMVNAKAGAVHFVRLLNFPPAQMGIVRFDDTTYIHQEYTSDTTALINAINSIKVNSSGITQAYGAFMNAVTGGIDFTKNRIAPRYLVFVTDGETRLQPSQVNAIVAAARAANVQIYTVTVSQFTVNTDLRSIATQTGGKWFEDVNTDAKAKAAFSQIVQYVYYYDPCVLSWQTTGCETNRNAVITLRKGTSSATQTVSLTVPETAITTLDAAPTFVEFGRIAQGTTTTQDVVITARNGAMNVQSITAAPSNFTIVSISGGNPPFLMSAGESRTVRVQYRAADTSRSSGRLVLVADAHCVKDVSIAGGSINPEPLTVVVPNGGETFYAGTSTTIRWRGVPPSTSVELDYSTNAGGAWFQVSSAAYALSTPWLVPNTPSDQCLMLASTPERRTVSKDASWLPLQPSDVLALAMAPSGGMLAVALADGRIKLHHPETGGLMDILVGHSARVNAIAFSPDVRWLVSGSNDGRVIVWNAARGTHHQELTGHTGIVHSVVFSEDGSLVASADQSSVILRRTSDWSQVWRITGSTGSDGALAIDARNRWVASAAGNNVVILDIANGAVLRSLTGHSGAVRSISVARDGQSIASGSDDRTVRVWNTFMWTLIRALSGHTNGVQSVVLGQSGIHLLSASRDRSVRVWDLRTGTVRQTFTGHTGDVTSAVYDWRTGIVASGSLDRTVRTWSYALPLSDRSDSLWTIITPSTDLETVAPDFAATLCAGEYSDGIAHVKNRGNQPMTITSAAISGPDSAFFSFVPGFSLPPVRLLQPEDTLDVPVRYHALAPGTHVASLRLTTDAASIPFVDIPLTGRKDSAAARMLVDTIDVGELYTCTLPVVLNFAIENTGLVDVRIDSLDADVPGFFMLASPLPHAMAAGEIDTFAVSIHPSGFGAFATTLRLGSTPCPVTLPLHVRGSLVSATPVATPGTLLFPYTAIGDTSVMTVTLRNPTGSVMRLESGVSADGAYELLLPALPVDIAAHDSLVVPVRFIPASEGSTQSQALFSVSSPCVDSVIVAFEGSSQRKPEMRITAGSFPSLLCETDPPSTMTVTIRNTGGERLDVALAITGTHAGDFRLTTPASLSIAPGASENAVLAFTPGDTGDRIATLTVTGNDPLRPREDVALTARKDSAGLAITSIAADLGVLYHCDLPAQRGTWLRNTGTVALTISATHTGVRSGVRVASPTFPHQLAAGDSVRVVYDIDAGVTGLVDVRSAFTAGPCTRLAAFDLDADLRSSLPVLSRTAIDFGVVGVGLADEDSLVLTNPTTVPMRIDGLTLAPAAAGVTRVSPATLPATLPPGGSLTLRWRYAPVSADTVRSVVTVVSGLPCQDTLTITMDGRSQAAFAEITAPTLTADIGTRVRIPIRMTRSANLALTGTRSFRTDLVYNRSILWPERVIVPAGTATLATAARGAQGVATITVQQTASPVDGVLAELECLVMLGTTDTTSLALESFVWIEGTAASVTVDGFFTALGICEADGRRFMSLPAGMSSFTAAPNPFNPATELLVSLVEEAFVEIDVYDALGRLVAMPARESRGEGSHRFTLDASRFTSGVYMAMLRINGMPAGSLRLICTK